MKFVTAFENLNFSDNFNVVKMGEIDNRSFEFELHDEGKCESLLVEVILNPDASFTMAVKHDSFSVPIREIIKDTEIVDYADIRDWFENYARDWILGFVQDLPCKCEFCVGPKSRR